MRHLALAITFFLPFAHLKAQTSKLPLQSQLLTIKGQLLRQPPHSEDTETIKESLLLFFGDDSLLFKVEPDLDGYFEVVIDTMYQLPLQKLRIKVWHQGIEWEINEPYPRLGRFIIIPTYSQPAQRLQAVRRLGHLWSGSTYKSDDIKRW